MPFACSIGSPQRPCWIFPYTRHGQEEEIQPWIVSDLSEQGAKASYSSRSLQSNQKAHWTNGETFQFAVLTVVVQCSSKGYCSAGRLNRLSESTVESDTWADSGGPIDRTWRIRQVSRMIYDLSAVKKKTRTARTSAQDRSKMSKSRRVVKWLGRPVNHRLCEQLRFARHLQQASRCKRIMDSNRGEDATDHTSKSRAGTLPSSADGRHTVWEMIFKDDS